ncbi:acyltransferase [Rubeoparvulum massiliense]|uniref:acyltransferase n=1 Tax=Rubeoparvulum massiliense TaxID=1631346 RepID=UPI00065DEDB6|nr:acyltransferase [Rubeoparvulum massiliense]
MKLIPEISLIRTIACLSILLIHTSAPFMVSEYHWVNAIPNQLARFGGPIFVMIGAFLLSNKYLRKPLEVGKFYRSRVLKIFIPYAVFTMAYTFFYDYLYQMMVPLDQYPARIFHHLLYGTAAGHLYFISAIFQFYLIFPLFFWVMKKVEKHPWIFSIGLTGVLFMLFASYYYHWIDAPWLNFVAYRYHANALFWMPYFVFGFYAAYYWESIKNWVKAHPWLVNLLGFAAFAAMWGEHLLSNLEPLGSARPLMYFYTFPIFIFFIFWVQLIQRYLPLLADGMHAFSRTSFGIYLIHFFSIDFYNHFLAPIFVTNYMAFNFAIFFVMVTLISFVSVFVLQRVPGGRWIVGTPPIKMKRQAV